MRLVGACSMLAMSPTGWAASVGFTAHLTSVTAIGDGRSVLQFDTTSSSCPATPQGFYVAAGQNGVTADGAKSILSTAFLAFALGKTLNIFFDSSTSYCYVSQAIVIE
jgi:hypothetical protein